MLPNEKILSRRDLLGRVGMGMGLLALADLVGTAPAAHADAAPNTAPRAFSRSYTGVIRSGRAAGSSSLGKRMRKRRE